MKQKVLRIIGVWTTAALLVFGLSLNVDATTELCPDLDSGKIDTTGDPATVTFTAPDGYLITSYCVKAGTTAVFVTVDPPAQTVIIDHPDKDSVSHYSVAYTTVTTTTGETTTSADTTTTTTSTTQPSTTSTTAPSTTTTPSSTTTSPGGSTSTSFATTSTVPGAANWSAGNTCDTVSVQFGDGILSVDAYAVGDLLFSFTEPGTKTAVVAAPLVIELVPIPEAGFTAVPDSIRVTVDHCTPGPSNPTTPDGEESLPFTGIDPRLGVLAGVLLLSGVSLVAWKGRSE